MASQSSTSSFEPIIDSKSIEEAIEDEELSFVMAEDDASDKIPDEMSKSKYSQVITFYICCVILRWRLGVKSGKIVCSKQVSNNTRISIS